MGETGAELDARVERGEDETVEAALKAASAEFYEYRGKKYGVHVAAMAFPLEEGEAFDQLVQSIRERGVRNPVLLLGDLIVDGRNRIRAALAVGPEVEIPFRQLGPDEDPFVVAAEQNLRRRDLTVTQRVVVTSQVRRLSLRVAALKRERLAEEAAERERLANEAAERERAEQPAGGEQGESAPHGQSAAPDVSAGVGGDGASASPAASGPSDPETLPDLRGRRDREATPGLTQEEAARQGGVSERSVRNFETVVKDAPELEPELEKGTISVKDALAVRQEDPQLRKQAVEDVKAGRAKTASQAVEKRTGRAPKAAPRKKAAPAKTDPDGAGEPAAGLPPLPSVSGAGGGKAGTGGAKVGAPPRTIALPAMATSPRLLLAGVRTSMGMIDLDPCSSDDAQLRIGAVNWFGPEKDGLKQAWSGSCYVFPPPIHVSGWAGKLLTEMTSGRVKKAAFLGPAALGERWAQRLTEHKAFTGLVLELERPQYEVEGEDPVQTGYGMALFLFGFDSTREQLLHAFGSWGVVLQTLTDE